MLGHISQTAAVNEIKRQKSFRYCRPFARVGVSGAHIGNAKTCRQFVALAT